MKGKLIIFSAPSGTGKSTIIRYLMEKNLNLHFSISATSRQPRGQEQHGVEYYFFTPEEFRKHIEAGDFLEYVEVYKDRFYGTLRSEVDRRLEEGENVIMDLDVVGAEKIKEIYGKQALTLYIEPPSIDALRERLIARATDAPEVIEERLDRAEFELTFASKFDARVINDDLSTAQEKAFEIVRNFVES